MNMLVPTCPAFHPVLDLTLGALRRWKAIPFDVLIVSCGAPYVNIGPRFASLYTGEDTSWSDNILRALPFSGDELFLWLDDYYLCECAPQIVASAFEYFHRDGSIGYLCVSPYGLEEKDRRDSFAFRPKQWRANFQAGFWRSHALRSVLRPGDDPWSSEHAAALRSHETGMEFLATIEMAVSYRNAVIKGDWSQAMVDRGIHDPRPRHADA